MPKRIVGKAKARAGGQVKGKGKVVSPKRKGKR